MLSFLKNKEIKIGKVISLKLHRASEKASHYNNVLHEFHKHYAVYMNVIHGEYNLELGSPPRDFQYVL